MTSYFAGQYDYVINDLADPRVKNWIGFSNPYLCWSIIGIYLVTIYALLPGYMKNRKPYSLKTFLFCYNVFQIVFCAILTYGVATSGWTTTYSWSCQPVDYSYNKQALNMLSWCYWLHILKCIELIETPIFILRKKFNQVTKLHVYHHCSTFLLSWILVKYIGGGMATFPMMLNSIIHILMYSYYLIASFGDEWQKGLLTWKQKLTMLQMIQFCVLIGHSLMALHPQCHVPKQLLLIYVPNVVVVFRMFWDFYKKSYSQKEKEK